MKRVKLKTSNARKATRRTAKLRPFRYPKIPFTEPIPRGFFIRGTSTEHSKRGGIERMTGVPKEHLGKVSAHTLHSYRVTPVALSFEAWLRKFEATMCAAIERSFEHSKLLYSFQNTDHLPVLLFLFEPVPHPVLAIDLPPYRRQFELGLVNGIPELTYPESRMPLDGFSENFLFRMELTEREYERAFEEAVRRLNEVGFDLVGGIEDYIKVAKSVTTQELFNLRERFIEEEDWWGAVKETLGHEGVRELPETGGHAKNPFTYIIGEHIKKFLLLKVYKKLKKEVDKINS